MTAYTIGETGRRSGFSTSALRYYEGIGLVEPSSRTQSGYRVYDDAALARLAFISRAKQLGCSLEEIADLMSIWDGRQCGPVQRRFHDLVTDKLRDAQSQVVALNDFADQLRAAAERLSGEPIDGPCDAGCACLAADGPSPMAPTAVVLGRAPAMGTGDVPIACTLQPELMADRLAEWSDVLASVSSRVVTDDGMLLGFGPGVDVGELGRLIAAEARCCAFFGFTLTVDSSGVALDVRAPESATGLVAGLFGAGA